jgi:hypothetical protein
VARGWLYVLGNTLGRKNAVVECSWSAIGVGMAKQASGKPRLFNVKACTL